jgi:hypothetical protein
VPVGNLLEDELTGLLTLEESLATRVVAQDDALSALAESLRTAKAGLKNEHSPLGVFLLAGPSGVGKTETALALADLLFGGEAALTTINMSEYQEAHTVSQLKGSPPGYVGYGRGGILTEAVRQRPYSVVLLDEVEKAHRDVLDMFYQVFDRGTMRDGEGREIDFRNCVILMTSNLGSAQIDEATAENPVISQAELLDAIHPATRRAFPARAACPLPDPGLPAARRHSALIDRAAEGREGRRTSAPSPRHRAYLRRCIDRLTRAALPRARVRCPQRRRVPQPAHSSCGVTRASDTDGRRLATG